MRLPFAGGPPNHSEVRGNGPSPSSGRQYFFLRLPTKRRCPTKPSAAADAVVGGLFINKARIMKRRAPRRYRTERVWQPKPAAVDHASSDWRIDAFDVV